jgi:hypothetical protein
MRSPGAAPADPASHVLLFATLGAPERRRLAPRKRREAPSEPEPTPVTTGRATVIDVAAPFADPPAAGQWLGRAGEEDLEADLKVLNRALHAFRLITADPHLHAIGRGQLLVARIGYGAGEAVADGRWQDARELLASDRRQRRAKVLEPQARLAALLGERERVLACEELALRARLDVDENRRREAALQVVVALDAAIAELSLDATAAALADRLAELRGQREAIAGAAQSALTGGVSDEQLAVVDHTLRRIEAALRARAVANA